MAVGIIVEWNPFHNGHKIHIEKTKELFPDEEIIAVCSGKYVQRGEISVLSLEDKTKIAKQFGVSKVFEIPQNEVIQAAKYFAAASLTELAKHNVDKIVFGSESDSIELLEELSTIESNPDFKKTFKANMKKGNSYKVAYSLTCEELSGKSLEMPNDILGFEYVKQIKALGLNITPYTIKRENDYHDTSLEGKVVSATAIREELKKGNDVSNYVPYDITQYELHYGNEVFEKLKEVFATEDLETIAGFKLVDEGIQHRFKKLLEEAKDYDEFINMANSKRYSSSRIKRTVVNIILKNKK